MTYAERLRSEYLQTIADCMAAACQPVEGPTLDSRARTRDAAPKSRGLQKVTQ